jgi:hypothetical protein
LVTLARGAIDLVSLQRLDWPNFNVADMLLVGGLRFARLTMPNPAAKSTTNEAPKESTVEPVVADDRVCRAGTIEPVGARVVAVNDVRGTARALLHVPRALDLILFRAASIVIFSRCGLTKTRGYCLTLSLRFRQSSQCGANA